VAPRAPSDALVAALCGRYGIGPRLVDAFLRHWDRTQGQLLASVAEVDAMQPPHSEWFHDALSSNLSARGLADHIAGRLDGGPIRMLELGCGLGGLLVAGAARGWAVTGFEGDSARRRLAAANLEDNSLEPDVVLARDAGGLLSGTWSVVVCLHPDLLFPDVHDGLTCLAAAVAPGGVLVARIANRTSLRLAVAEPRTGLLGVMLVDREVRRVLLSTLGIELAPGATQCSAVVVRNSLVELGFDIERLVIEPWPERPLSAAGDLVAELCESFGRFAAGSRRRLDTELAGLLDGHILALLRGAVHDLAAAAGDPDAARAFHERYLVDFETLVAQRS
jgi:SAM-dependent methyltransferase